ncbi:MAG: biotin/lipoyl-containing protein, partial [Planctomycetota bacterium]
MAIEIKVPALGEGVNSGDVLEVFVKVGDTLQINDNVVELETDKATVTIPATTAGKVLEVLVKNG